MVSPVFSNDAAEEKGELLGKLADPGQSEGEGCKLPPPDPLALRQLTVQVPESAKPGHTKLRVSPNGESFSLLVTVPQEASVGDLLIIEEDGEGGWSCVLQRPQGDGHEASGRTPPLTIRMTHLSLDAAAYFEEMVRDARQGGAYVSSKLARCMDLPIPGVVAKEAIADGELLLRVPARLQISPETCKKAMPELHSAVSTTSTISAPRRAEAAQTTCVASLLSAATRRIEARSQGLSEPQQQPPQQPQPPQQQEGEPEWHTPALWDSYAESLLAENFERHPYWRSLKEHSQLRALLEPSGEASHARMMGGDTIAIHKLMTAAVTPDPGIDIGHFLKARLCLLTREFGSPCGSALVPLADLCNHSPDPGASQRWSFEEDAMIVVAVRAIEKGEEVFISYGPRSSPLLMRTYGFTLPPASEPTWTFACQVREMVEVCRNKEGAPAELAKTLEDAFLPLAEVHLDTTEVASTLAKAMDAYVRGGGDAFGDLRHFCGQRLELYERSASLKKAIGQLREVRKGDPQSPAWWTLSEASPAVTDQLQALHVTMSEYICLLTHSEALDLLIGGLQEEQCLSAAVGLSRLLSSYRESLDKEDED